MKYLRGIYEFVFIFQETVDLIKLGDKFGEVVAICATLRSYIFWKW
jgi:hypothetical protein